MINLFMFYLFLFVGAFSGAMFGSWLWSKRKWRLVINEKDQSLDLIQDDPSEATFLSDPTAEELEEMEATGLRKLLLKFKKNERT